MTPVHRIALVGLGKIAVDQHIPSIRADRRFALAATASLSGQAIDGVPAFATLDEILASGVPVDAVALLTPPSVRAALAHKAISAGKSVLLEKPPATSVAEFDAMRDQATKAGVSLFATWHSRFNAAVAEARRRLAGRRIAALDIEWKEDVRRWHPGQEWIWQENGFGVLDPGINAFSIATEILDGPLAVRAAAMTFPANRAMPIAADIAFDSPIAAGPEARLTATLDWRQEGEQTWTIEVRTDRSERLVLSKGGARLDVDGVLVVDEPPREYPGIYARFASLLETGGSDADGAPLALALDALARGERRNAEPFNW